MFSKSGFNDAVTEAVPKVRNVIRKMIGHPDQLEDVLQDTLVKAWENIDSFKGQSKFSTWLCAIAVNSARDFLRKQQRWRAKAQIIYADQCINNPEFGMEVGQSFQNPAIAFDVKEHITYCFSCIGRSIDPVEQAALVLRDVLDLTNLEAANVLGVTESVFRQHLTEARKQMQEKYKDLCALVNKEGVCYQCAGLREGFPEDRKGEWPVELDESLGFELRLKMVKDSDIDTGKTQIMHEIFWKRTEQQETNQVGDESVDPDCGKGVAMD